MIDRGIVVHWMGAREYIPIDPLNVGPRTRVQTTYEWWTDTQRSVDYITSSKIDPIEGGYELRIFYRWAVNKHIKFNDAWWGSATYRFGKNIRKGMATWRSTPPDEESDDDRPWEIFRGGRSGAVHHETVERVQRDRGFHDRIAGVDRYTCAITGEMTETALEAAHIEPTCSARWNSVHNGVLLRADLHRLFDEKLFDISPDGAVVITEAGRSGLSKQYKELLSGRRLKPRVLDRIREALSRRR